MMAEKRSDNEGIELADAEEAVRKDFDGLGELLFSFDSGTTPALKQLRQKLIMARAGSLSLIADEIGSNLLKLTEILEAFLELYDKGIIGDKLLKNTADNKRIKQVYGSTPSNIMLFGTPLKLFDGGATETALMNLLTTGYARRCFFGFSEQENRDKTKTAEDIFNEHVDVSMNNALKLMANKFTSLADMDYYDVELSMSKANSIFLIEYKMDCESRAEMLPASALDKRAELEHSYFKVLKLAGVYAFIDGSNSVKRKHLESAMKLANDSSITFAKHFMEREQPHVRLLRYLVEQKIPVTHADMMNALGFYPKTATARKEMMVLAASQGYKENSVIEVTKEDNGIELFKGVSLEKTKLTKCIISYSKHITSGYNSEAVPFMELHKLMQLPEYHWVTHKLRKGYRDEDHVVAGSNLIVLDVDSGTDMNVAATLLKEYTYYIYTTKRHTNKTNRFRIILPMSHVLNLNEVNYKLFMRNIFAWLPFKLDDQTGQRARKWLTNNGTGFYNEGILLDVRQFIPKTPKAVQLNQVNLNLESLPHLEKWFTRSIEEGNRSNQLIKYALMLVDMGLGHSEILSKVNDMNSSLDVPLPETEIYSTLNVTVAKKIATKEK